jgi:NAD(P)-dependent dehydrogenase (short-subunit alcohol dehydrogenase family)
LIDLKNKLILVTGSGAGVGCGIAITFAKCGADLVIHYNRSEKEAEKTKEKIISLGRRCKLIKSNLKNVEECRRTVDEATKFLGGLDALVNNAGLTMPKDFYDIDEEHFNDIFNLNFRSYFFCSQQAIKHLIERGEKLAEFNKKYKWAGGSIVNISSVHGKLGFPGHSVYASTKGAINSFTKQLSVELISKHIRVNAIAPGTIEVPSYFEKDPSYNREFGNSLVPWGRVGLPEEVGSLAAYLVSDLSEFMTGEIIHLDGGLTSTMNLKTEKNN